MWNEEALERAHRPILMELRRGMRGWRKTAALAQDVCSSLSEQATNPCLRLCAAEQVRRVLAGRQVGPDFDQDWASSLLLGALRELRRSHPRSYGLLTRTYDRPEGAAPLTPHELAAKLARPEQEVEQELAEGRAQLKRLFLGQIEATVADPELVGDELSRLEPYARRMFGGQPT